MSYRDCMVAQSNAIFYREFERLEAAYLTPPSGTPEDERRDARIARRLELIDQRRRLDREIEEIEDELGEDFVV